MTKKTPAFLSAVAILGASAVAVPAMSAPSSSSSATGVSAAVRALHTARDTGRPYDLERDRYRGRRVWEVDVAPRSGAAKELKISANGKRVVHRKTVRDSADARRVRKAKVSFAAALRTAAKRASGRLTEAELDRERGRLVWSATFERGNIETDVDVDAKTGKVVRVHSEHDD
jgi:uncharacterized membrane protein YkoI